MSIDFNALTSKLENTTAAHGVTSLVTFCAWARADGLGENSLGAIIALDDTGNSFLLRHQNVADVLLFYSVWTGNDGQWTFPATDGQWNAVAVSYDGGATANDPIARVNFAAATVTDVVTPTLAHVQPTAGYCVGNRADQIRTWDGQLAHAQVFDRILTATEMDSALRRPGSITSGLRLWLPMADSADVGDDSGNGFNGTATDLATGATDPVLGWGIWKMAGVGGGLVSGPSSGGLAR